MSDFKIGKYKHYKGNFYQVIAVARDSEDLKELVVYRGSYYSKEFGNNPVWVRPLTEFLEEVEFNGKKVKRFEFIE